MRSDMYGEACQVSTSIFGQESKDPLDHLLAIEEESMRTTLEILASLTYTAGGVFHDSLLEIKR